MLILSLPPTSSQLRVVFDPPLRVDPGESIAAALQRQPEVVVAFAD